MNKLLRIIKPKYYVRIVIFAKKRYLAAILALLLCFTGCDAVPEYQIQGVMDVTMQEMVHKSVQLLGELEIHQADEGFEQAMIESFASYPEDVLECFNFEQVVGLILTHIGMGTTDFDAGTWTPSSDRVYAFDTEVFDIGQMYTLFLTGVQSISRGELTFTDIEEDLSGIDWDKGEGVRIVRFLCNGSPYQIEVETQNDWFDFAAISKMNEVFAREGLENRLWYTTDGYQECILFYDTPQWAEKFSKHMGYSLR